MVMVVSVALPITSALVAASIAAVVDLAEGLDVLVVFLAIVWMVSIVMAYMAFQLVAVVFVVGVPC